MLGVTMRTVQLWADGGVLACWKTEGGHRRITTESLDRLLASRKLPGAPPAEQTPAAVEVAASEGPIRILIVDDEPAMRRLYRMQLARWPMAPEVATANNGIEGLVILGALRPHLLIADLNMPGMDGYQMLLTLRAMPQLDATEIVVVTGVGADQIADRGGLPEGIMVLPKPVPFDELQKIAERVAIQNGCRSGGGN